LAELNISPPERKHFPQPQAGASERQEQRIVFRAQRLDGIEKPLQFVG
jgi:hypothetical protein